MNDNAMRNAFGETNAQEDAFDFDELEAKLEASLEENLSEVDNLIIAKEAIGNPETIGTSVLNTVWDQIVLQIGAVAGEDFIKENRGLTLDLRKEAHFQTTENFAKGKIATHNTEIDYQKRYDEWQDQFEKDESGNIATHKNRLGKEEVTLKKGARKPFDEGRPSGSAEKHTDMDHTVSAGEIIRDPAAAAHMTREEQIAFANSDSNLNEIDSSLNKSKSDLPMEDWLDNPNSSGQKPREIFDIDGETEQQLRDKDKEARAEYEKRKKEAEQRSIEAGKTSRKKEAFRIGGKALRSAIMVLLAELARDIIQKLIAWLRSGQKALKTFIKQMNDAITNFIKCLKKNLMTAGEALVTTIALAIWGPIVDTIKKVWMFLKQGYRSIKEALAYLRNPDNKNKSASVVALEVGKIVVAGASAAGTLVLGEMIELKLLAIPVLAFQIPLFGTLANILGMFLGALISGILGALVLNFIDRLIAKSKKRDATKDIIKGQGRVLDLQKKLLQVESIGLDIKKDQIHDQIKARHEAFAQSVSEKLKSIFSDEEAKKHIEEHAAIFDDCQRMLDEDNDDW